MLHTPRECEFANPFSEAFRVRTPPRFFLVSGRGEHCASRSPMVAGAFVASLTQSSPKRVFAASERTPRGSEPFAPQFSSENVYCPAQTDKPNFRTSLETRKAYSPAQFGVATRVESKENLRPRVSRKAAASNDADAAPNRNFFGLTVGMTRGSVPEIMVRTRTTIFASPTVASPRGGRRATRTDLTSRVAIVWP